ncbi:MAG: SIS domain-containing protein, partial [Nitrososphaeraceae archaeon]
HGPIALIEKGTLVVGLACQEELNDKVISNLKEVKARGAEVLIIAMEDNEKIKDVADNIIYIPRTNPLLAPILENVPQQLLAYHMAVALGNDVDKPRNLAKSVTVE